jgi:uncharacterized protein YijF (DUF1287 family)/L,D-peptidoglycan transpeptidase YkuD (ErfK/YbiS/YcfS/YnhG family)
VGSAEPAIGASRAAAFDRGIFDDLNERIVTGCAPWTQGGPLLPVRFEGRQETWLAVGGFVTCAAPASAAPSVTFSDGALLALDRDRDGIPDGPDILRGAKKAAANGAHYRNTYRDLTFPGGDVPRNEGVCTDVVVRALRNAGFDLQELLATDLEAHPERYPSVKKPDPNIDHRRVRTLLPYFNAHFSALPTDARDTASPYLPGDVVFMNTLGDAAPEHVGIVSDTVGASGLPLIINNWTEGWTTREMDLLDRVPVTHRFRVSQSLGSPPANHVGVEGLLARRNFVVPAHARQLVLVTTPLWTSSGGTLMRFARAGANSAWAPVGRPLTVRVGAAGLGCGRGLHDPSSCADAPPKREGDRRAPAGVFALGTAFGRGDPRPFGGSWPYRSTTERDRFVDDPQSPHYNTWQVEPSRGSRSWTSAERLSMYSLGLVVEHNTEGPMPGAGSAIFLHPWKGPKQPTVGCTALDERELRQLLAWLEPAASPVLVQVAGEVL